MNSIKFKRIGAFLIDAFIINGLFVLIANTSITLLGFSPDLKSYWVFYAIMFAQSLTALLYTLICLKLYNGTLGKRVLGFEIISKRHQGKLSTAEMISREWSKWIIIYFFSALAILVNIILFFAKSNSIHDALSKTTVKYIK